MYSNLQTSFFSYMETFLANSLSHMFKGFLTMGVRSLGFKKKCITQKPSNTVKMNDAPQSFISCLN